MVQKELDSITFGFLDPELVRKISSVEISDSQTYDIDGYPIEGGLMDPHLGVLGPGLRCKSCGQKMGRCHGHFGHLDLIRPVIHVKFNDDTNLVLNTTCRKCGRILLDQATLDDYKEKMEEKLDTTKLSKDLVRKAKKIKECAHCGEKQEDVKFLKPQRYTMGEKRLFPNEIREWLARLTEEDFKLLGYNEEVNKPEWWILTVVAIPPVTVRPSIALETGQRSEDDLTHKLAEIVRSNQRLKENINAGAPQIIIENMWDLLQYHVTTYFDNKTSGIQAATTRDGRELRTLAQRLSGKEGRFRHSLSGKRVDYSARTVVSPDPYISINEIGLPVEVAMKLAYPEKVTEWNLNNMKKLIKRTEYPRARAITRPDGIKKKIMETNRDELAEEVEPGSVVERDIVDGDITLFNRQPSLHRMSEMAHIIRILPGRTFRIHPSVTASYNADFDGDQMNIHFPTEIEARIEAKELMSVEDQIISPRHGGPLISAMEDHIAGFAMLTSSGKLFDKDSACKYALLAGKTELPKPKGGKDKWTGKQLFSLLLPDTINLEYPSKACKTCKNVGVCKMKNCKQENCDFDAYVKIKNGELICGVIDSASVGGVEGKLLIELNRSLTPYENKELINRMIKISGNALNQIGVTISETEYIPEGVNIQDYVKEAIRKGKEIVRKYRNGELRSLPGLTYEESFEFAMIQTVDKAQEEAVKAILYNKMASLMKEKGENNSLIMILSGARGSIRNVMNISAFQGQAKIMNQRPKTGYEGRLLPSFKEGDLGLVANGFITSSLIEGQTPREFFFGAMGGRIGEIEAKLSIRESGYLQRQAIHAVQDLCVRGDYSVRGASDSIVQFTYGEDGVFPGNTRKGATFTYEELVG